MAEEDKKELEIVEGDGSEIDISEVSEHLSIAKPKINTEKKKDIIIPKSKKQ